MEGNASVYQVNLVSRISGEGRAEFLRTWGPDFDQKGGGRGGKGGRARVGQVYLCVETIIVVFFFVVFGALFFVVILHFYSATSKYSTVGNDQ